MNKFVLLPLLLWSFSTEASQSYASTVPSLVQLALENAYGIGAGAGVKNNSCLLCHTSVSGGPGNINVSFGDDFVAAANRLSVLNNGGGGQNLATLSSIFDEAGLKAADSDMDGFTNEQEFLSNDDPASDVTGGAGGGGGGCGTIGSPPPSNPSSGLYLLLMPLFMIFILKKRHFLQEIRDQSIDNSVKSSWPRQSGTSFNS